MFLSHRTFRDLSLTRSCPQPHTLYLGPLSPLPLFSSISLYNRIHFLSFSRVPLLLFGSWIFLPPGSYLLSQTIKKISPKRWFLPKENFLPTVKMPLFHTAIWAPYLISLLALLDQNFTSFCYLYS